MNGFRSINLLEDHVRDEVVALYRPTRKSLQVVRAVCGLERSTATHVVAPYGTGKSFAALAGIILLSGTPTVARALREKISAVDSDLATSVGERDTRSFVILLHGACADLPAALAERGGVRSDGSMQKVLEAIVRKSRERGSERVLIVWDEFGQHLETLVREGRLEDLLAVQDLAEWTVRRTHPRVTFTTLMHQGVYHYIRRVSETAQSAWKKFEGRFETLNLIEDGVDAMEMLAEVLKGHREFPDASAIARARAAGMFANVPDDARLEAILSQTAPLTPAALHILPRLAAQVAQAERTLFTFLDHAVTTVAADQPVGVDALYDFFAPSMRADTGPGGTHRRFIETETALSRTETEFERQIVKTAALLQLGPSSERVRLPRARLVYAASEGTRHCTDAIEAGIDALVARKVLLHRRRVDDVAVWHGADLDLAQMVSEEAARFSLDSDPAEVLERLFPPDAYTAAPYNHTRAITRFARARYVKASDITSSEELEALRTLADTEDTLVALVIDATADHTELLEIAATLPPHFMVALPRRSTEVAPILADLLGIEALLERPDILETDPLVKRELLELKAEAEASLRQALERLLNTDRGEVVWISGDKIHAFDKGVTPGDVLSRVFENRFSQTPMIRNEQVVRRKVSAVTRSARKRCILAVLERTGSPYLGYEGSTSADASIYRTVLERPGLYAFQDGAWGWSRPSDIHDPRMARVWRELEVFFATPGPAPKSFAEIIDNLTAPPIGLREGVLPLLIAAGLAAFGRALAIRERSDGRLKYVDDVQPSLIEKVCDQPGRFELEVVSFTQDQMRNLERMIRFLVGELCPEEPDRLRGLYDALLEWRGGLPPSALSTRGLGEAADVLQPLVRRKSFDPLDLVVRELPRAFGEKPLTLNTVDAFQRAVEEMEAVSAALATRAAAMASGVFNARLQGEARPLLCAAEAWAACVPLEDETVRILDHEARGVLSRARAAPNARRGELGFVTQLSGILRGEGLDSWDETTLATFRRRLEAAVLRVEEAVLNRADGSEIFEPFLRNQLATIFDTYRAKIGRERLIQYLDEIYRETS